MPTRGQPERGQAAAEFALVLPVLALLVVGLVDFGLVMYQYVAAINAAREAARHCALHPARPTDTVPELQRRLTHRVVDSFHNPYPTPTTLAGTPTPAWRNTAELGGRYPVSDVVVRIQTTNLDGTANPVIDYCPQTVPGMEVTAWVTIRFDPITPLVERWFPQQPMMVGGAAHQYIGPTPVPTPTPTPGP